MGRKPLSKTAKVIQGTFRKSRENHDTPEFEAVTVFPEPPNILDQDGVEMWNKLGPQLVATKILQTADLYMLEQLCYTWQRFRLKAATGAEILATESNALKGMFAEFGMTPASRSRVTATGIVDRDNKFSNNGKRQ